MKDVAYIIKNKINELGLPIDDVCEKLKKYNINISTKALYGYENALREPSVNTLMVLCEIYKIDNVIEVFG